MLALAVVVEVNGLRFYSGDGILAGLEFGVEETEGGHCRVDLYDPDRSVLDRFSEIVFSTGLTPPPRVGRGATGQVQTSLEGIPGQIANHLLSKGWSKESVAMGLGVIEQESGFDPCIENLQGSGAFGLIQWLGSRRTAYQTACPDCSDIACALDYLESEVDGDEFVPFLPGSTPDTLKKAPTLEQARVAWSAFIRTDVDGARYQYAQRWLERLNGSTSPSVPQAVQAEPIPDQDQTGSQIVISVTTALGTLFFPYLHTGCIHEADTAITTLEGQSGAWVLARSGIVAEFDQVSAKEVAEALAKEYGFTLQTDLDSEQEYEHFTIAGEKPLQVLADLAHTQDKRLYFEGTTIRLVDRDSSLLDIVLKWGVNLAEFQVEHRAQWSEGDPGTRSSDPSERTRAFNRPYVLDPLEGAIEQLRPLSESEVEGGIVRSIATLPRRPIEPNNEQGTRRVKGIQAKAVVLNTVELFFANPDDAVLIQGLGEFCDRLWVMESVYHTLDTQGNLETRLAIYSPLLPNLEPGSEGSQASTEFSPNTQGFAPPMKDWRLTLCSAVVQFGNARGRPHQGVDVYSPTDPTDGVYAAKAGTVVEAGIIGGYGYTVIVDHGAGTETLYAHLAPNLSVKVGDRVQGGQRLGTMSGTGSGGALVYGIHLHFEIRVNGAAIDPESVYGALQCG